MYKKENENFHSTSTICQNKFGGGEKREKEKVGKTKRKKERKKRGGQKEKKERKRQKQYKYDTD